MSFLYRYMFRRFGLVFVLGMVTVLWTACNYVDNRAQEKKAKDEAKRMLDAMHKDADKEIRKYTSRQTPLPPAKKESSK
jgi:outer membrane biogenesis lipoprotein LolB